MTTFRDLALAPAILDALEAEGYQTPTEVQAGAIPHGLEGRDLLAVAQTGTGKTAAFSLPMLHQLSLNPRCKGRAIRGLVLTPTRELALQVRESLKTYGRYLKLSSTVVMGGVAIGNQIHALRKRPDILVATPGRLLDLMNRNLVKLDQLEFFVLDEADRMLDMGFIHDIRKVVEELPEERQTFFFSATMPPKVKELANTLLRDPASVEIARQASVAPKIEQHVHYVDARKKAPLLEHLLADHQNMRTLVFVRTRHRADRVSRNLYQVGIRSEVIHSDKSQGARQRALKNFTDGRARVLIGTDIVSRGIDVDNITHVINYDLPDDPENHVHRIGRTGRAGESGIAASFCDDTEVDKLRSVEKMIGQQIRVCADQPYHCDEVSQLAERASAHKGRPAGRRGKGGGGARGGNGSKKTGGQWKGRGHNRSGAESRMAKRQGSESKSDARGGPKGESRGEPRGGRKSGPKGQNAKRSNSSSGKPKSKRPAGNKPRGKKAATVKPSGSRSGQRRRTSNAGR